MFDSAENLKLTVATHSIAGLDALYYSVMVLPKGFRPDDALSRAMDCCLPDSGPYRQGLSYVEQATQQCAGTLYTRISNRQDNMPNPVALANAGVVFEYRPCISPLLFIHTVC